MVAGLGIAGQESHSAASETNVRCTDQPWLRLATFFLILIERWGMVLLSPNSYLADVLARINGHPNLKIDELLPWNWKRLRDQKREAA